MRAGAGRVRGRLPALVVLACLVGVVACTGGGGSSSPDTTEGAFRQGGELRLAAVDVTTFDPAAAVPTNQAEMITIDLLYDGLTVFPTGIDDVRQVDCDTTGDSSNEVTAVPDVAQSITPSADATVWTVKLGERAFSDGSPIRAADVKATYERLAKKGSSSLAGVRLELINGYQDVASGAAAEMSGLQVRRRAHACRSPSREPYVQLPELLASPLYGIVPKASADEGDAAFATPVGSGPYAYADHDDVRTRLERSSATAGRNVGPDAIDLVGYSTWDDAYQAFVNGDVDWSLVPAEQFDAATSAYGSDNFVFFGSELWLGFNLADPTYADARFRQAIVQAIDSNKVVADTLPGRSPLRAIVPRDVPGYNDTACANLCEYAPDVARAWLTEAFPDGAIPTVTLDGYDDPTQIAMLNSIQAQLGAVGIPGRGAHATVRRLSVVRHQRSARRVQLRLGRDGADAGRVPRTAVPLELTGQRDRIQIGRHRRADRSRPREPERPVSAAGVCVDRAPGAEPVGAGAARAASFEPGGGPRGCTGGRRVSTARSSSTTCG